MANSGVLQTASHVRKFHRGRSALILCSKHNQRNMPFFFKFCIFDGDRKWSRSHVQTLALFVATRGIPCPHAKSASLSHMTKMKKKIFFALPVPWRCQDPCTSPGTKKSPASADNTLGEPTEGCRGIASPRPIAIVYAQHLFFFPSRWLTAFGAIM
jgi:hypothetical protein